MASKGQQALKKYLDSRGEGAPAPWFIDEQGHRYLKGTLEIDIPGRQITFKEQGSDTPFYHVELPSSYLSDLSTLTLKDLIVAIQVNLGEDTGEDQ